MPLRRFIGPNCVNPTADKSLGQKVPLDDPGADAKSLNPALAKAGVILESSFPRSQGDFTMNIHLLQGRPS